VAGWRVHTQAAHHDEERAAAHHFEEHIASQASQGLAGLLPSLLGNHPEQEGLVIPDVDGGRE